MFGKKKKKPKLPPRPTRKPKPVDPVVLARRRRMMQLGLGVVIGAVAVTGVIAGLIMLRNQALQGRVPPVREVILSNKPEWMDQVTAQEICQTVLALAQENPSDPGLPAKAEAKLAQKVWVKRVAPAGVVNNYDGSVSLTCEFRKPLALVSGRGVQMRVDDEAVVLPGIFLPTGLGVGQYKRILGVISNPPEAGQVWNEPDILAAVELLKLLEDRAFSSEIFAVNVSNYNGRQDVSKSHLVITTDGQAVVNWGRAIGTEGRIEVSHQQKLENLERLFLQLGTLNKLNYADLRGRDVRGKLRDGQALGSR